MRRSIPRKVLDQRNQRTSHLRSFAHIRESGIHLTVGSRTKKRGNIAGASPAHSSHVSCGSRMVAYLPRHGVVSGIKGTFGISQLSGYLTLAQLIAKLVDFDLTIMCPNHLETRVSERSLSPSHRSYMQIGRYRLFRCDSAALAVCELQICQLHT